MTYFSGNAYPSIALTAIVFTALFALNIGSSEVWAGNIDPLAANNGLYPRSDEWSGSFRVPNYAYPKQKAPKSWSSPVGRLSTANAPQYMSALKQHLSPTLKGMINTPLAWQPKKNAWFSMIWSGQGASGSSGVDPNSGLESLLSSATGQIMPADTFDAPYRPTVDVQNHAVTYYNSRAATTLAKLWKDVYQPNLRDVSFPEGSIIVKAEAATPTEAEWPVLKNGAKWYVYRPSVAAQQCSMKPGADCSKTPMKPEVLELTAIQMSIAVKDKEASPQTGWVFLAFTYQAESKGETAWDRFVPLGAQWGNDPQLANSPTGRGEGGKQSLTETWNNPDAPAFTKSTLGWGDRLAGPMDVATRHNVVTVSGVRYQGNTHLRASSCISCHGAAEFPMTSNLYPSPNITFPTDGEQFLMFDPGSPEWSQWFQNRKGDQVMSRDKSNSIVAVDYDWVIVFALMSYNAAMGNDIFVRERFDVH